MTHNAKNNKNEKWNVHFYSECHPLESWILLIQINNLSFECCQTWNLKTHFKWPLNWNMFAFHSLNWMKDSEILFFSYNENSSSQRATLRTWNMKETKMVWRGVEMFAIFDGLIKLEYRNQQKIIFTVVNYINYIILDWEEL